MIVLVGRATDRGTIQRIQLVSFLRIECTQAECGESNLLSRDGNRLILNVTTSVE